MRFGDRELVRSEYASEERLLARRVRRYVAATIRGSHLADSLPKWEGEFHARSSQAVFVAEEAS